MRTFPALLGIAQRRSRSEPIARQPGRIFRHNPYKIGMAVILRPGNWERTRALADIIVAQTLHFDS